MKGYTPTTGRGGVARDLADLPHRGGPWGVHRRPSGAGQRRGHLSGDKVVAGRLADPPRRHHGRRCLLRADVLRADVPHSKREARDLLFVVGGVFTLYFAYSTLRQAKAMPASGPARGGRFPYLLGLTIGLTNPFQLAWWIAVGIGMVSTFGLSIVAGFFVGIIAWTLFFSTILRVGLTRYRRIYPVLVYVSGAILVLFGLWFLYSAISSLA